MRDGPPARHSPGDRPLKATTPPPQQRGSAAAIVRRGGRPAALIALSDERDLQLRLRLAAWRAGYQAGSAAGYQRGYAQAVRDWKVTAGLLPGGPTFAELDRRRYPPDGRRSWILPRPGEADGGERR